MKKTIYILLLTALISVGTSSCTDWLSLRPEGEMVLDEYWQTESDAQQVMAACYRGLIENDCTYRMLVWGELRSDDFTVGQSYVVEMRKIMDQEIEPTNLYCTWGSFYAVINYCNTFLKYAPTVLDKDDNFTEAKLHEMEAEVYTIRALSYFYLVRAFQNVPWISTPSIDDNQEYQVTQSSERAVLDSIIVDLKFAGKYANKQFTLNKDTKGRITQNAVHALLADVYLWDQQYDNCIKECDKVLADENLSLVKAE
ncbi:MAG: RagB/SusD family nutrient uptake outer membrane protein, partial [Bacteroidota bacterium]|nr:RagB/SusD family nutrient uptake outer membrane protein [Bacteroidota bacterium]